VVGLEVIPLLQVQMEILVVQEAADGAMVEAEVVAQAHPAKVILVAVEMTVAITTAVAVAVHLQVALMREVMRVMVVVVQHHYYQVLQ
jgi:hypothetical protein